MNFVSKRPYLTIVTGLLLFTLSSCNNAPAKSEEEAGNSQILPAYEVFYATPQANGNTRRIND